MAQQPKPGDPQALRFFTTTGGRRSAIQVVGTRAPGWSDLYHYLVRKSWAHTVGALGSAFLATNALFGFVYMTIGGISNAREGYFPDYFFFSVQTIGTIGYGAMFPQTLLAHAVVTLETMIGMLGMAMATGLVFAKFSRPKARVIFSNVAVISHRDGIPTLMFRVANERQNHIVEAQLRVVVLRSEKTKEGETVRRMHDIPLMRSASPAFILTWTVMHQIVPGTPLYGGTVESLKAENAEILITFMGVDESINQTIHARHSYLWSDLLWGHRLADIITPTGDGRRVVDYGKFHDTVKFEPPPNLGGSERPGEG